MQGLHGRLFWYHVRILGIRSSGRVRTEGESPVADGETHVRVRESGKGRLIADERARDRGQTAASRASRMDLGSYLQKGLSVLQLDTETIRDVGKDEDALVPALLFFALAGIANGAGQFSFSGMVFGAILVTLLSFVLVGLLNVLSRLVGGTASFLEIYRPLGIAASVHWVQAVPVLGPFLGLLALLYFAAVAAVVVETTGHLARPKAAAVVAALAGISLFLCLVFLAMLGALTLFRAIFA